MKYLNSVFVQFGDSVLWANVLTYAEVCNSNFFIGQKQYLNEAQNNRSHFSIMLAMLMVILQITNISAL